MSVTSTESGVNITGTNDMGVEGAAGTSSEPQGGMDLNASPQVAGQPTADTGAGTESIGQEQSQTQVDENLTPENLSAFRASLTQEAQKLAAERQTFAQQQQQIQNQVKAMETINGIVLQNPQARAAYFQGLVSQAPMIADQMIAQGYVAPGTPKDQLVREIIGKASQQSNQPYQPNPYQNPYQQPPVDPNQIANTVLEQVQQKLKAQQTDQNIENTLSKIAAEYKQETGKDFGQKERMEFINFAVGVGNNPLEHAWKLMNYDKNLASAAARERQQVMMDLRNGADPFAGAQIPVADSPEVAKMKRDILNAS